MGRPARNHKVKRLNLDMSVEIRTKIEEIQKETKADSLTSVIKTAVKFYDYFLKQRKKGCKILIDEQGTQRELIILE